MKKRVVTFLVLGVFLGGGALASQSLFQPKPAEASRLLIQGGDLYQTSNVFGSKKITSDEKIKMLFDEGDNNRILTGKGVARDSESPHSPTATQLYISRTDGAEEVAITEESNVRRAFFGKDKKSVFYFTDSGEIYRYDVQNQKKERVTKEASIPQISPEGKSLVYQKAPKGWIPGQYFEGSPGFVILDLATGKETVVPDTSPDASGGGYSPIWAPDGKHLVFFNNFGLGIVNADGTGETQLTRAGDGTNAYGISDDPLWSSDGRYFIYVADYRIIVAELDSSYSRVLSAGPIAYGVKPRWVEEGKTISVLSPFARAGEEPLSVIDLNGNVVSGEKKSQDIFRGQIPVEYRVALTGRVSPKPATPIQSPAREQIVPASQIILTKQPDATSVPRAVPQKASENAATRQPVPASAFNKAQ